MSGSWATRWPPHIKSRRSQRRALERAVEGEGFPRHAEAVALVLAAHSDGAGFSFLSIETIVREGGYGRRSVFRALALLKARGAVEVYPTRRDPTRADPGLSLQQRIGQGISVYLLGAELRAAARLREVDDLDAHLGLVRPPEEERLVTPVADPPVTPVDAGEKAPPRGCHFGTPTTNNGKHIIEEGWLRPEPEPQDVEAEEELPWYTLQRRALDRDGNREHRTLEEEIFDPDELRRLIEDGIVQAPCRYRAHADAVWFNDAGRLVCGICHPPVTRRENAREGAGAES